MMRLTGTIILLLGAAATFYAAVAFFLLNSLPPNNEISGRLPSLYVLLGGMGAMLVRAAIQGVAHARPKP